MKFGAFSEETRPASEASDTTREPFDNSSESESLNDSVGGSSNGIELNEAPPQLAFQSSRPAKFSMPRQPGLQHDRTVEYAKATMNSSPEDFAAAWTHAASTGAWKREEKNHHGQGKNQASRQRQRARKAVAQAKEERCFPIFGDGDTQDMPLPKWFSAPTGALKFPAQDTSLITTKGATLAEDLMPLPARCDRLDMPLKIFLPGYDTDRSHLNLAMPCKKRVPDWEL
jgi:hypothetical protein